ncbi:hypothetical protein [Shewanella woodyi]|uniref:hypothetical protein n=1 Tax=Shewanella woodyi TaxID=60961 RepID=UPI003747D83C
MSSTEVLEWDKFCKLEKLYGVNSFSFPSSTSHGEVYRFGARFSLASDLAKVSINGRTQNTSDGYAQLMRTVMAWGVVESFFDLKGISINHETQRNSHMVPNYDVTQLALLKSKLGNSQCIKFFRELKVHTNPTHTTKLDEYLNNPNGSYDVSYLFSAIRHVFAHGILTPHTGKVTPKVTVKICKSLVEFFLGIVNAEFGQIVRSHADYASV